MKPFDARGAFCPEVGGHEVRSFAVRGAGATLLSGGLVLAIQMIATIALARLVSPADFGLVTLVTTFSLLLLNFGLNGFTEAILQREEINHALASNLFWINLGAGVFLSLAFAAGGPLLAHFYGNRHVARVAVAVSATILITSASVIHLALLKRAMRFPALSANDVIARIASVAVSIFFAWLGWGYWALVVGVVTLQFSTTIGAWYLCRWLPGIPRHTSGTADMVRYGLHTYGRFSINYFARNVDNVLVGWRFGSQALGFYKRAYDLFALSVNQLTAPLTTVAVSALSRFHPRSTQYRQYLFNAISVLALIGMGLGLELTFAAQDLIRLLLGRGWEPAARIFALFGPGIGAMVIYYVHSWIHLSVGTANRWLRWGLVEVSVICLLFLVGLHWGPYGIAGAWTASYWILIIPSFKYAGQPIHLGVSPLLAAVWKFVAAAVIAGAAAEAIKAQIHLAFMTSPSAQAALARLAASTLLVACLYVAVVVVLHRGFAPFSQVARLVQDVISIRKRSPEHQVERQPLPVGTVVRTASISAAKPVVSVLIPAYNAQEWIAATLCSVLAQTWEPKEIIVVDDGSRDGTVEIARQFESKGVRIFTQRNQGAAAARNKAFSLCHGDYIQWLDADDLLAPDKIARQMAERESNPSPRILLSSPFGRFRYRYYRASFVPTGLWRDQSALEWLLCKLGQNAYMQTATWLVSRELSEMAGPWDTKLLSDDDGEYFCRVLLVSEGVRFVPDSKVYYRSPWVNNLSYLGLSGEKLDAYWHSIQLHVRYIRSLEDSERVRSACVTYMQKALILFYPQRPDIVHLLQQTARDMGKELRPPQLPWKYSWIRTLFGWDLVKRLQIAVPLTKWHIGKSWDKAMFQLKSQFRGIEPLG